MKKNQSLTQLICLLVFSLITQMAGPPVAQAASQFNQRQAIAIKPQDRLAVTWGHTCVITSEGFVRCWGLNEYGQLGNSSTTFSPSPVYVHNLDPNVRAITAGFYLDSIHTCALTSVGGVKCWGGNQYGQLGDNSTTDRDHAVDVSGLSKDVTAISAGGRKTCAITASGGVKCWGAGQLVPIDVPGLSQGVVAIDVNIDHSCVLTTGGGVKCWGQNDSGQLGDNSTTYSGSPVDVFGLDHDVIAISTGSSFFRGHTCALTTIGSVKCWGQNNQGQLGDNSTIDRYTPVEVSGLSQGVTAISAGSYSTCALTSVGGVKCWGRNDSGELGDNSRMDRHIPGDVSGLDTGVIAIRTGLDQACALTAVGGVKCWGGNEKGQLGTGSEESHILFPQSVVGFQKAKSISAGGFHTCLVTEINSTKCWGGNAFGQLGDGSKTDHAYPVDASRLDAIYLSGSLSMSSRQTASGTFHTCVHTIAISHNGFRESPNQLDDVKCMGSNERSQIGSINNYQSHSYGDSESTAGGFHSCALVYRVGVMCWGYNASGQLGNNSTTDSTTPVVISGLDVYLTAISAGGEHTCALGVSGGVVCWGNNGHGQLGDKSRVDRHIPVAVSGLSQGVAQIAAGGTHTCALTKEGAVKCWGWNEKGQLGDNSTVDRSTPVDVVGLGRGVKAIAAGGHHTCALTGGGGVKCWGYNESGQLGDGSRTDRSTPVDVVGLSQGVSAIAAGLYHTCALGEMGWVKCWGLNNSGQVGNGEVGNTILRPANVSGFEGFPSSKLPAAYLPALFNSVEGPVP